MTAFTRPLWMFVAFLALPGLLPSQSAWLGIDAESAGNKITITEVLPGSPAKKAGLKVGDTLVSFQGKAVGADLDALAAALSKMKPGTRVRFEVLRSSRRLPIVAVLGVYPGSGDGGPAKPKAPPQAKQGKTAARKVPKRPGTLGVEIAQQGEKIWVESVVPHSPAAKAGFKPGDQFVSIAGKAIADVDRLVSLIRAAGAGNRLAIVVRRGGRNLRLTPVLGGPQAAAPGPAARRRVSAPSKLPTRWLTNYETALALAKQTRRPLLIDFAADWCQPCKLLERSFKAKDVVPFLRRCVLVRVDVDKFSRLADRFGVQGIPHVVMRSPEGKTMGSFTGYLPPDELAARLRRFLGIESKGRRTARSVAKRRARSRPARRTKGKVKPQKGKKGKSGKNKGLEARKAEPTELQRLRRDYQRLLKRQRALEERLNKVLKILEKIK